jgi:hypothetical protein
VIQCTSSSNLMFKFPWCHAQIRIPLWQPAQENTVLSPKTNPLWPLSNSKVSSCRWLLG